jgi:segregation and condensation protein A
LGVPLKQQYEVKIDLFEGPLDLLLYLVQKDEVDITQISVARVAEQYLAYLDLIRELNINVAAEYLYMAATLVRLKAHELLPAAEPLPVEESEGIYNREQLVQQLLEYKKYKEAARSLRQYEASLAGSFPRGVPDIVEGSPEEGEELLIGAVSSFDLLTAFMRILQQAVTEPAMHISEADAVRIDDRIEYVLTAIADAKGEVRFEDLFMDDRRRLVLVVTFMALLELVKMQEIVFRQEANFAAIYVCRRKPETREKLLSEEMLAPQPQQNANGANTQAAQSTHEDERATDVPPPGEPIQ